LLAKQTNGQYKLRIEDTDLARSTKIYEQEILDSFRWFGLDWDAGPEKDDGMGPYYQMQRLEIYNKRVQQLIDQGDAYYAWETAEELEAMRELAAQNKQPFNYREQSYTPEQLARFAEE
jgi:glutamyl/glutaminyl-tRNA synthetase